MTLPMLAGFDDTVGPGLAAVAQTVANVLQPYKQTELQLRDAIAKNPQIAQQLADLEFSNPGSTGRVFGPNVQAYASALKPSIPAKIQNSVRDGGALDAALADPKNAQYLAGQVMGFQPSQVAGESQTLQRIQSMEKLMADNPNFREDRAFQDVLGKTRAQYANEQADLSATQGAEAFLTGKGAGMAPMDILGAVLGENPNLKLTTKEIGDLFNSPTYGKLFSTLMSERLADRREELRLKVAKAQTQVGLQDDLTKLKVGRALTRATEIENANPAAVAAVLYGANDPAVTALGGVTDPKDPNYSRFQQQVTDAKTASEREGAARDVKRVRDAQTGVVNAQKVLGKIIQDGGSDADITVAVNNLNDALEEAGKLTGRTVVASYTMDPERFFAGTKFDFLRNKGIYYFDHEGKPVTEASVLSYVGGTGDAKSPEKPKKEGADSASKTPDTAAVGNSNSGNVGGGSRTSTRTSESFSASSLFTNAKPEMRAQLDRIGTLQDRNERQKYYDQLVQQNPNLSEDKKKQLRVAWKLEAASDNGSGSGETREQAIQRISAAFDKSETDGENALRELERTRGNDFADDVAANIPAK